MYDEALKVLGKVVVGDQRLHGVIDANAASSSSATQVFVLGSQEAKAQKPRATTKMTSPLDLEVFERQILEDIGVNAEMAAQQLAKAALARQYRDASGQQLAIVKRQKLADVERYEAETKAAKEAAVEKLQAERDRTQVERVSTQAERQKVEDTARADREERERQRVHAAELAAERRKAEIRQTVEDGLISQTAADEMLGENRQTFILRLEEWIRTRCGCPAPSSCSGLLSKKFNEAVETGRHVKPASHRSEAGRWKYFVEHDGPMLAQLHQEIHDRRNHVSAGQGRLAFSG
jgi:hypothetical protein